MTDIQQDHGPTRLRRFGRTKNQIDTEDAVTVTWLVGLATVIVAGGYLFLATVSGVDQAPLDAAVGARSEHAAHTGSATTEGMEAVPVSSALASPSFD